MKFFNFTKVEPIPAGIYQKQSAQSEQPPYRIHLRLQRDGSGVLIVNAATVLHLNPTAAEYAYHFIKGSDPEVAAKEVAARYRVNKKMALQGLQRFRRSNSNAPDDPRPRSRYLSGLRARRPAFHRPHCPAAPRLCPDLSSARGEPGRICPDQTRRPRAYHRRMGQHSG